MIDISTAFLQSNPYPKGQVKYVSFKSPFDGKWYYFRQLGPIYGEASAPARWQDTIAPWLTSSKIGFTRGINEPCVFYHAERDILLLLYVDDVLVDALPDDAAWIIELLKEDFECKDEEYLTQQEALDYLGMIISMDADFIYLSMEKYITNAVEILDIKGGRTVDTPITKPIVAEESTPLDAFGTKLFLTAVGMLGWLSGTVRLDISYAYSRIAQHSAKPTQAALDAAFHVFRYLDATKTYAITIPQASQDRSVFDFNKAIAEEPQWKFFTDTDRAGNAEVQNKRRSQNGYIATRRTVPVDCMELKGMVCRFRHTSYR